MHVPRAVLGKLTGMMGYTFLGGETLKLQAYTSINQNYWDQRVEIMKLFVFDDEENDELVNDIHSFLWTERFI